jgi:alpha-beta hydrolase superfamily lysophospholipase
MTPVEFMGPAGVVLRGERAGEADRWVVLVHDEGRDLDGWRPLASWFAEHDFSVLVFDLPGHGASDDPWQPDLAVPTVVAAIEFARSEGARHVHLVGEGTGAIAALAAAADLSTHVASIAAFSPRLNGSVTDLETVREARVPKLILVGTLGLGALQDAEAVFRSAIGSCELAKFPVEAQGADLLVGTWGLHARETVLGHAIRHP